METLLRVALSNAVSATFLALLVGGLGRLLARRPAVMHCLWLLVLLKLVTPPLFEAPVGRLFPVAETEEPMAFLGHGLSLDPTRYLGEQAFVPDETLPPLPREQPHAAEHFVAIPEPPLELQTDNHIGFSIGALAGWFLTHGWQLTLGLWLSGSIATFLIAARRIRRFRIVLQLARPVENDVQRWIDDQAGRLGLRRSPVGCWVSGKVSPMLWAFGGRPRLILPTELWKLLDERQRLTLVIHELAHLRRGDHHVRVFELVVTILYWWHPVLWWSRKSLHDAEEQCCDAWVLWACPDSARCYAETLLDAIDFLNKSKRFDPVLASGFGSAQHLRRRLTMIMNETPPRLRGLGGTVGAICLAALLPIYPTWGQEPASPTEEAVVRELSTKYDRASDTLTFTGRPEAGDAASSDTAAETRSEAIGEDERSRIEGEKVRRDETLPRELNRQNELGRAQKRLRELAQELEAKRTEFDEANLRFMKLREEAGATDLFGATIPRAVTAPSRTRAAKPAATTQATTPTVDPAPNGLKHLNQAVAEATRPRTQNSATTIFPGGGRNADSDRIERLEKMLEQLNREVAGLKQKRSFDPPLAPPAAPTSPADPIDESPRSRSTKKLDAPPAAPSPADPSDESSRTRPTKPLGDARPSVQPLPPRGESAATLPELPPSAGVVGFSPAAPRYIEFRASAIH